MYAEARYGALWLPVAAARPWMNRGTTSRAESVLFSFFEEHSHTGQVWEYSVAVNIWNVPPHIISLGSQHRFTLGIVLRVPSSAALSACALSGSVFIFHPVAQLVGFIPGSHAGPAKTPHRIVCGHCICTPSRFPRRLPMKRTQRSAFGVSGRETNSLCKNSARIVYRLFRLDSCCGFFVWGKVHITGRQMEKRQAVYI